jgi:hypothetical protein
MHCTGEEGHAEIVVSDLCCIMFWPLPVIEDVDLVWKI